MGFWGAVYDFDGYFLKLGMSQTLLQSESVKPALAVVRVGGLHYPCWVHLLWSIAFGVGMIILIKWFTALPEWQDVIASENGPIERMSAALWFMAFIWCLASGWSQNSLRVEWLGLATVLLLLGLRELDAHVWITRWNLDKLTNYWNPQFPLNERLLVLVLMILPCVGVAGILLHRLSQRLGPAWANRKAWVGQMALGISILLVCMILDKAGPYFLPVIGLQHRQVLMMELEEMLEGTLALYTVSILWPYWQEALFGQEHNPERV